MEKQDEREIILAILAHGAMDHTDSEREIAGLYSQFRSSGYSPITSAILASKSMEYTDALRPLKDIMGKLEKLIDPET